MKFFPTDYVVDTRPLTLAERGLWVDILCILWREDPRGSATWPAEVWAGKCGCSVEQFLTHLQGIKYHQIGHVSIVEHQVSISSRRMQREQTRKEQNKLAQRKHRQHNVSTRSSVESEVRGRSQKSEAETEKEKREEERLAPPPPKRPYRVPKGLTEFPTAMQPSDKHLELGKALGVNTWREFAKFKDGALSKGRKYKDWDAAFRVWITRAEEFAQKGGYR